MNVRFNGILYNIKVLWNIYKNYLSVKAIARFVLIVLMSTKFIQVRQYSTKFVSILVKAQQDMNKSEQISMLHDYKEDKET